ncbi:MAG: DinB family protein [Anaerolineales bacterium]
MTERQVTTKAELLADTEQSWSALNAALDRLTEAQLTTTRDAQGWSVKDHLVHLTAWERSMVYLLNGRARHEGLGVDEAIYLKGEDDEINAVIQAQQKDLPLTTALAQFRAVHQQLLHALEPLTDADLQLPYRHYLPDEPGEGDGPPVLNMIYGNSADHFAEHLGWIESLVGKNPM